MFGGESFGFVNFIIQLIGGDPVPWSSNGNFAFIVVLFATAWGGGTAFNMLIFIGAIISIPQSLYEAADVDGGVQDGKNSGILRFLPFDQPLS
ncbi:hypothetical protein [Gracilibacillus sp. JCM 18860]|uniref:hypothetical protein n=1 Tax=Gracilibacillus sp. JCM 18860 TaxID=1306159 RepID=UPI0032605C4C